MSFRTNGSTSDSAPRPLDDFCSDEKAPRSRQVAAAVGFPCLQSVRVEAAGSGGVEPPCVLQDFMHGRFASSTSSCLQGSSSRELVRVRCAATVMMPLQRETWAARRAERTAACALAARACARSRKEALGSRPQRPPVSRAEPQGGCGFRASAASCLAQELGVGFAPRAPCCELKGEAPGWLRFAGTSDGVGAGGIDSKLSRMPKWHAIAHDLGPPRIGYGDREINVSEAHVAGDPCPSLLADTGDCPLEREGAGS
ncbi:hypothetical protein AK812_SmicGene36159 [Symbiodinium microadriaticum]|uniref:Uncharacterized protein n=1 Tax=Symbiodinium microadriaticum TaxID=2951 RepID=A0A1Q9CJL4_SYMMI|nr:hypothetical protein AK812_SmicGene36159 [Symbiodinium microadriaticum]